MKSMGRKLKREGQRGTTDESWRGLLSTSRHRPHRLTIAARLFIVAPFSSVDSDEPCIEATVVASSTG